MPRPSRDSGYKRCGRRVAIARGSSRAMVSYHHRWVSNTGKARQCRVLYGILWYDWMVRPKGKLSMLLTYNARPGSRPPSSSFFFSSLLSSAVFVVSFASFFLGDKLIIRCIPLERSFPNSINHIIMSDSFFL